ncbi:hypothetical protein [Shinella sp.]|uniref:hypothetical protein n=1 Tax=Shinella sp. TaxID=1870904 RepID=UPI0029A7A2B1|nr:hypothetical protein [Shinella sp.]MDX3973248.1 hypothetical protein [Shinella sp.]
MENTALWDKLGKTDPKHTKEFTRGGGFKGTAIKPMFSYRRLTEEFGPCGTGWGVGEPSFQVVNGDNREILVFCTVSGWYVLNDERRTVYGVGGDKIVSHIKANEKFKRPERWENDDEAFKKAFTDALTNAFKLVGVGADVHMGMFDDNKYVNAVDKEFREEEQSKDAPKPITAAEQKRQLEEIDKDLLDAHSLPDVKRLFDIWLSLAERDGWSKDYWDAARRKFAAKKKEIEDADGFPGDFPGGTSDADLRNHPMNAG